MKSQISRSPSIHAGSLLRNALRIASMLSLIAGIPVFVAKCCLACQTSLSFQDGQDKTRKDFPPEKTRRRRSPLLSNPDYRAGLLVHLCRFSPQNCTDSRMHLEPILFTNCGLQTAPHCRTRGAHIPTYLVRHQCARTGALFAPKRGESQRWCTLDGAPATRIAGARWAVAPWLQLGGRQPAGLPAPKPGVNRGRPLLDYHLY